MTDEGGLEGAQLCESCGAGKGSNSARTACPVPLADITEVGRAAGGLVDGVDDVDLASVRGAGWRDGRGHRTEIIPLNQDKGISVNVIGMAKDVFEEIILRRPGLASLLIQMLKQHLRLSGSSFQSHRWLYPCGGYGRRCRGCSCLLCVNKSS